MNKISKISSQVKVQQVKFPILKPNTSLKNKTCIISGASRGIGFAIAKALAAEGVNIVILAKTTEPHPKLPGTIYTAAEEIEKLGGKCLPLKCDIRFEEQVESCVKEAVAKFGGIDFVVNNASAINLSDTEKLTMKGYDLMNTVNARGTYLLTKVCLPYLKKSGNGHVLNLSPPLLMSTKWFSHHVGYTIAKYGMSMCVLGWSEEFKNLGISVNALWPRTAIATAAVQNHLGGDESIRRSRNTDIISDCVLKIFKTKGGEHSGYFFIDESLLRA